MDYSSEKTINLGKFLWDHELAKNLAEGKVSLKNASDYKSIEFNWSEVRFFDDISLVKLIMIEECFRAENVRISYRGFGTKAIAGVLWQLQQCGFVELVSSGIMSSKKGKWLYDKEDLFQSDPIQYIDDPLPYSKVMKIVGCHGDRYFGRTSRASKKLEEFDRLWHTQHFSGQVDPEGAGWELLESGEFRRVLFEQTRINIWEHAEAANGLGLAMARIIEPDKFQRQWRLSDENWDQFLKEDTYLTKNLQGNPSSPYLQTVTIDNGCGIPDSKIKGWENSSITFKTLREKHRDLIKDSSLFDSQIRFYKKSDLKSFGQQTGTWKDGDAVIISFATHPTHGSSKANRPIVEEKGLTGIVERVRTEAGQLLIESCNSSVCFSSETPRYGAEGKVVCNWCLNPGTSIRLALPLGEKVHREKQVSPGVPFRLPIDFEDAVKCQHKEVNVGLSGTKQVKTECSRVIEEIREAKKNKELVVLNWAEFNSNKDQFVKLLIELADQLREHRSDLGTFVYANVPWNLKEFLKETAKYYSEGYKRDAIPVCVFVDSLTKWYWLGLDTDETDPPVKLRALRGLTQNKTSSNRKHRIRQAPLYDPAVTLTGRTETSVEAYYRFWFNRMLELKSHRKQAMGIKDKTNVSMPIKEGLVGLIRKCPYLFDEGLIASSCCGKKNRIS